jgi:hypothetical protein
VKVGYSGLKDKVSFKLFAMGRLSSDNNTLAVIVTTLGDHDTEPPVKNTFIHFKIPKESSQLTTGCVQRFRTDPSSEPRSRLSSLCVDEEADITHSQVLDSTSGSSTPTAMEDDSSSAGTSLSLDDDELDQEAPFSDWIPVSTPVSYRRWMPRPNEPSGALTESSTLKPTLPCPVQTSTVPQSSLNTQPMPIRSGSHRSSFYTELNDGSAFFGFTLRRAQGVAWGLETIRDESIQALVVKMVMPGGAIKSWNRQIMDAPNGDHRRELLVGDRIVAVNGKHGCENMLVEIENSVLLKVEVLRPKGS